MELLSEESSFSRKSREDEDKKEKAGNLLLWSVAIMVLLGLNAFSWIFCMYVFGHPEEAFNYNLLSKLDKIPPLKGFTPVTVPRGKFHSVKEIYAAVYEYSDDELKAYNDIKKRHYLKNYKERDDVTFISGEFVVQNIRKLNENDVFPSGFAIRAWAEEFPDGLLDFVIPSEQVPEAFFKAGEAIKVEESLTCAALLHVERLPEDQMVFTVVPLVNREFTAANGSTIQSKPPERLNLASNRWPLSDTGLVTNPIRATPEEEGEKGEKVAAKSGEGGKN
ncbi:MAG: hypothetical protein HKN23_00175 [Verrucomicrobiales bacterium]|nr:hypothetical protein [Verrucomicrobiales bacterium]